MQEILVANFDELPDHGCKVAKASGVEIGVFRVGDEVFVWRNVCAHQGGPVCQGRIFAKVLEILDEDRASRGFRYSEDELHIVCPWHGYEYDVRTGRNSGHSGLKLTPVESFVRDRCVYVRI